LLYGAKKICGDEKRGCPFIVTVILSIIIILSAVMLGT